MSQLYKARDCSRNIEGRLYGALPESKAKELHCDEIELEDDTDPSRVSFVPFIGISPFRYREIFQKGKRKASDGKVLSWLDGEPMPRIDLDIPLYTNTIEIWALAPLLGDLERA
jgi:hypothetical protein